MSSCRLFPRPDPDTPALQKVALSDLNLDANPIPIQILVALKPVIQQ